LGDPPKITEGVDEQVSKVLRFAKEGCLPFFGEITLNEGLSFPFSSPSPSFPLILSFLSFDGGPPFTGKPQGGRGEEG